MPTTTANGVLVPVASDAYALTSDLKKMAESASVVISVLNTTERADAITQLNAVGQGPSSGKAVYFDRADLAGACKLERTVDGVTFTPVVGADTGWTTVAMEDGWTTNSDFQVRKIGNVVYWRGVIRDNDGTIASGLWNVCSLPASFRPSRDLKLVAQQWINGNNSNTSVAHIDVAASTGLTTIRTNANTTGVAAGGVSYLTD